MSERDGVKVTRILREAILRLQYRPGQNLDEAELSEVLGVSRTPIREAIIQLVADGLVVREGRRARVAPLDFDDVPKLYDALLISSRMIQRLAAEHRTGADLEAIRHNMIRFETATTESGGVERSEANLEFHRAISHAAANRYFEAFYEQVLISTIRLSRACFVGARAMNTSRDAGDTELEAHLKETMRQHRLIFAAIERRDAEEADALAVLHHGLTTRRLKKVLFASDFPGSGALALDINPDRWDAL